MRFENRPVDGLMKIPFIIGLSLIYLLLQTYIGDVFFIILGKRVSLIF